MSKRAFMTEASAKGQATKFRNAQAKRGVQIKTAIIRRDSFHGSYFIVELRFDGCDWVDYL